MKHVYRYLLAAVLVPVFLLAGANLSWADNDFHPPVKKGMQIQYHQKNQIVRNGSRPAHRSVDYIKKKKNDSFSHLNN